MITKLDVKENFQKIRNIFRNSQNVYLKIYQNIKKINTKYKIISMAF